MTRTCPLPWQLLTCLLLTVSGRSCWGQGGWAPLPEPGLVQDSGLGFCLSPNP